MRNTELYVVTGVSGRTGSAAAHALLKAGKRLRVVVRDVSKGKLWADLGAEVAIADLSDIPSLTDALSGVQGAYIVSPQQYGSNELFAQAATIASAIAQAATKAQLPKIVALSSIGAEQSSGTGWIAMNRMLEQNLAQIEIPVTFLRAAYFMENWGPMLPVAVAQDTLPSFLAPLDEKFAMIATADIGHIAAEALLEVWGGIRVLDLAGPTAYSPNDVANALTLALNKPVQAVKIPESDWAKMLSPQNFSPAAVAGFIEMTQGINARHIDFSGTNTELRKGRIPLEAMIATMVQAQ